ncbi:MAG: flagellar biosynthesis protein FlgL [Novosphingobium sp. 28-62-57]|uniref:flagellin N-terminal helical domain-containing protein n=1 Tax=unclassified Novosphingobium TaxID=2644732 RepID=UPI000BCBB140|nr:MULTISPECIES: flagellar biosynthesis protein FlgL [unclassified Novosphingobium]OYW47577.1 MAG: flagellar biosynthesis protein FlgL [Novosphingobium sp. 12-63-9]OYZ08808.1 MAG: flagellar biosynthesis protein FlgL [Novosphingobium sp. 28-62-57]OZA37663.1 MAG: flagellar biosynthesis protein FlgL [Novosphingobium sp. 17-62-9]HQS70967.1 flagellar biosynthesis protein FlgL [Novosphingobium sp.]
MTTIFGTSTASFYERSLSNLSVLRGQAEETQAELSSGQRLQRSSDDPVAASRLRQLARADAIDAIDTAATNRVTTDLTLADDALSQITTFVIRLQELTTQAASSTLSASQRAGIGQEVAQIRENLVGLANSRDGAGNALFGGESAGVAYTLDAAGNASYAGTSQPGIISLGAGQSVSRGVIGPEFLQFQSGGVTTDLLALTKTLADALTSGTGGAAAATAALTGLGDSLNAITTAQTVIGSRLNWIDLNTERRIGLSELRLTEQAEVGGTDLTESIAKLQNTMLVLEASQASFSRLANLSLFSVLR